MEAAQFVANNYYNQNLRLLSFVRARAGILNGTAHFEEYADPCFVTDSVTLQLGATEETMNAESEIRRGAFAPGSADLSSRTSPPSHSEHQSGFANCMDSGRDPAKDLRDAASAVISLEGQSDGKGEFTLNVLNVGGSMLAPCVTVW